MELVSVFHRSEIRDVLTPDLAATVEDQEPATAVIQRILDGCSGPTYLDDLSHIDVGTWLVDDVLLKADKMSMAHSLEARVPFLDHHFAEFAASMPASFKLKGWKEKHVLREAMRGLVPDQIIERKKHGFTVALSPWNKEGGILREVLSEERLRARGWVEPSHVQRLLQGDVDHPYIRRQLFALVILELWAQIFLDGHVPATLH